MTQLFDVGQEECSVLFLWTYLVAAAALTAWSTVYMWILSWRSCERCRQTRERMCSHSYCPWKKAIFILFFPSNLFSTPLWVQKFLCWIKFFSPVSKFLLSPLQCYTIAVLVSTWILKVRAVRDDWLLYIDTNRWLVVLLPPRQGLLYLLMIGQNINPKYSFLMQ